MALGKPDLDGGKTETTDVIAPAAFAASVTLAILSGWEFENMSHG